MTDSIDLSLALSKLKVLFGVQQFAITGGAKINGAFFQAGLVDAVSLVIAPSIDGSKEHKTIAELITQSSTSWKLKASTAVDAGLHLIWQKVCLVVSLRFQFDDCQADFKMPPVQCLSSVMKTVHKGM